MTHAKKAPQTAGRLLAARRALTTASTALAAIALGACATPRERAAATPPAAATDQPNIILIVADDLGHGDLSAYGGAIRTPNIDALARSGIRYDTAYSTAPICSPSRAGLLSGRFQGRFGFYYNLVGRDVGMPAEETTIAEVAKQANYQTAMIGKWHVGDGVGRHPLDQGFDSFFGFLGGATSYYPDGTKGLVTTDSGEGKLITRKRFPIMEGRETVNPPGNITDVFTDRAVKFVGSRHDRPFFLYLAYNAPHSPYAATTEDVQPFAKDPSPQSRIYKAMMTKLDQNVGRLMGALKAHGLDRRTIVFFISDNGCPNYAEGACSNAPFAGWKAFPLEGGVRVPFILSAPGRVKRGQVEARPISTLDIMPTMAAAMHRPAPPQSEGQNLLAPSALSADRTLFWRMGPNHWTRSGPWKLITINKAAEVQTLADVMGKPLPDGTQIGISPLGQWQMLFDIVRDRGEANDLSSQHPEVVADLERRFDRWDEKNIPPAFTSRREFRTEIDGKKVQLIF
jgi:arylsulfatase A-like enzyme